MILGTLHSSKNRFVRWLVLMYTTLFRGTPMLIQILFARYALPRMGIMLPAFWSAVCAIGLNSGAYISFIIHSGISSVPRGQVEAGKVLGFSYFQILRYIVLPQALQIVFPALGNEFITLIKDSSLASVIGVPELTQQSNFILSTQSRCHHYLRRCCADLSDHDHNPFCFDDNSRTKDENQCWPLNN